MNELTFVSRLATATRLRAERLRTAGKPVFIVSGDIEEREVDPVTGRVVRCDMRLNSPSGSKLLSGEFKRPEVAAGRDPRSESLRADARKKAMARGLAFYFTCNLATVVLYALPAKPGMEEEEIASFTLADLTKSSQAEGVWNEIETRWFEFLDEVEARLLTVVTKRPSVTRQGVVALRTGIERIVHESMPRVRRRLLADPTLLDSTRDTARQAYGLSVALNPAQSLQFNSELEQVLRLSTFVVVQKLILYRVLSEAGPKRAARFSLDPLRLPDTSTDPAFVHSAIRSAVAHAINRSGDFETAFILTPHEQLLFTSPATAEEAGSCAIGEVWDAVVRLVEATSWVAISQNLVGFLYETIIEPRFRHELGQYYTPEDVVDLLTTFAIRDQRDEVLDPCAGGGSFLRSSYRRKVDLGALHEDALAELWGCEITAFAAQLTSITLATADTQRPAAYPRVVLQDFFKLTPGAHIELEIPGEPGPLTLPTAFDAVVGNPPYISYRRQTNQEQVARSLQALSRRGLRLPVFSGKSDEYVWFLVAATEYLRIGGRLAFVVSSALIFSDYGLPLIQFIGRHYKIVAVVDSLVEQWFEDADTNTVLLMLERQDDSAQRESNAIRFVRLRQPLARLLPDIDAGDRRQQLEFLVADITSATEGSDPRFQVNVVQQGPNGGLRFAQAGSLGVLEDEQQDEEAS
jgi:hypothetical protein